MLRLFSTGCVTAAALFLTGCAVTSDGGLGGGGGGGGGAGVGGASAGGEELVGHLHTGFALEVDDATIYYGDWNTIQSIPKAGGTPKLLYQGSYYALVNDVALDGGDVYWITSTELASIPRGGGQATIIASKLPGAESLALDADNFYVATSVGSDPTAGTILKIPRDGQGQWQTLFVGLAHPRIVVDGGVVYWADYGPGGYGRVDAATGESARLLMPIDSRSVRVDADYVYGLGFGAAPKTAGLARIDKQGVGPAEVIASDLWYPEGFVLDGGDAYVLEAEQITRVPLDGGPREALAAFDGDVDEFDIAVDASYVYWITQPALSRVSK